jgi:cytochrome P450
MEPDFCPAKFDLFDPDLQDDPYCVLAEARRREPVFWSEQHGGFWALTRYEDIYEAAHDPATFASKHGNTIPPMGNNTMIPLHKDPPEHLKYRTLAAAQFGPRAIATLEDDVRAIVTALIDGFIERGECEFSEEFAEHLPGAIIARLVGAPEDDRPLFVKWSADLAHADADDPEAALAAAGALWAYLADLVNARRAEPRNDLTTHLLNAEVDGQSLSDDELCNFLLVVVAAGTDTTTGFLENTLYCLATHPDDRRRLTESPELIPSFIEEMLRYDTSVPSLARTVTRDVEFRGKKFRAGDKVSLLWASGNRDGTEFPEADTLLIDREPNRHIAFGTGIHRCLGSHLARLETRVALEELLTRLPDLRIGDPARLGRRSGMIIRGVKPLPLAFTPGPRNQSDKEGRIRTKC